MGPIAGVPESEGTLSLIVLQFVQKVCSEIILDTGLSNLYSLCHVLLPNRSTEGFLSRNAAEFLPVHALSAPPTRSKVHGPPHVLRVYVIP